MAPRGARSLLRRLLGAHGAALMGKRGLRTLCAAAPRQDATAGMSPAGVELGEAAIARSTGARAGRCDSTNRALGTTKVLAVCGLGAAVLWSGAGPAVADDVTPPAATTTIDAPPPDPYKPPVRSVKPKPAAPRRTYTPAARTYTPPASSAPRPAVQTSRPHGRQRRCGVPANSRFAIPQRRRRPPPGWHLFRGLSLRRKFRCRRPMSPMTRICGLRGSHWCLAVAGLSLQMLSMRYFDPRFE